MKKVVEKCVPDAQVIDICEFGDKLLTEETSKVYKKEKEMKKGELKTLLGLSIDLQLMCFTEVIGSVV